jgi:hypothetical protein
MEVHRKPRAITLSSSDFCHVLCEVLVIFPWRGLMFLLPVPNFEQISEPRRQTKNRKHRLSDILSITLYGVWVGWDDWSSIAEFGRSQEVGLRTFLPLENGIPSHDTFGRVFSLISPKEFEGAFFAWAQDTLACWHPIPAAQQRAYHRNPCPSPLINDRGFDRRGGLQPAPARERREASSRLVRTASHECLSLTGR